MLNGQQSDSGYYQCLAQNEVGMDIATAYITFNRKRKSLTAYTQRNHYIWNYMSSQVQCALDVSVISGKPFHNFFVTRKLLKNLTIQILNFSSVS